MLDQWQICPWARPRPSHKSLKFVTFLQGSTHLPSLRTGLTLYTGAGGLSLPFLITCHKLAQVHTLFCGFNLKGLGFILLCSSGHESKQRSEQQQLTRKPCEATETCSMHLSQRDWTGGGTLRTSQAPRLFTLFIYYLLCIYLIWGASSCWLLPSCPCCCAR